MKVGFIGLGIMGEPIAMNILKDGHALAPYNRTPEKAQSLKEAGATIVGSPDEIGDVDVLVTCVSDGFAEEALFFEQGLIDRLPKTCVHMSSTTIGVPTTRRLVEAHAARGRLFVTAPVLGRAVDMAAARKLFVIAAGPAEGLTRCKPLFEAISQRAFVFGDDPVTATAVKLAVNFLSITAIEAMGEAFALTGRYGVKPDDFYEFMTGSLFPAPPYKAYGRLIAQDSFTPANFVVPLGLKDVRLAMEAGELVDMPLPSAGVVRDHLVQALAQGYSQEDWSVIARVIRNNLTPKSDGR
jgi:3-hydroxyisobutyrate dehydrogenase-like beta-hydroxyacid dehydrogenase